jgi:hypothetical protein
MRDLNWIIADNKKAQEAYDARQKDARRTLHNARAEAYRRLDYWFAQSSNVYALNAAKPLVGVLREDEQL